MSYVKAEMHQIRFRLGLRPRSLWGSLQRSPRPPTWRGLLLRKRRERMEGKGDGRVGERGKGDGTEPLHWNFWLRHCLRLQSIVAAQFGEAEPRQCYTKFIFCHLKNWFSSLRTSSPEKHDMTWQRWFYTVINRYFIDGVHPPT